MLVTPDRTAATRVAAELARFGVEAEETAGLPLPQTPAGALALLVAELLTEGYPAAKLVSLFGHPEVRLGLEPVRVRVAGRTLEARVLRGPKLAPRLAAVDAMAERLDGDVALIVTRFSAAMAPLEALRGEGRPTLAACLGALEATLALLTEAAEGSLRPVSRAERELLSVLDDYAAAGGDDVAIGLGALPATLRALIGDVVIRTPARRSRVIITGPLEARLMRADRLVLLGLNEGTWPAAIDTGPWLSRPMRRGLGFAPPEIRIGLSAHDFAEALGTDDVVMIRAARSGGAPTVPTRFLQRLVQLIGPAAEARLLAAGARHLDRARRIDDRPPAERFARPEPKPPLAARPCELTVTEIETLIRDPYAVYAKRVLKLRPLPDLGELPDFGTRGTLVHDTLRDFVKSWTGPWDGSAVAALRVYGGEKFAGELSANPELLALWLPRFEALAEYVVLSFEALRGAVNRHAEIEGAMPVGRDFTLKGRADRIDEQADGRLSIVDFKTGAAPTDAQIAAQLTPQLPLEAVMAARGGFADLGPRTAAELVHVVLRGLPGRDEVRPYRGYDGRNGAVGLDETIEEAGRRLEGLVAAYADPAKGYLSRARPFKRSVVGDYDHLARVKEWMVAEDEGGEE
jgi:ATP-dependent helicase/nuclease subunit B